MDDKFHLHAEVLDGAGNWNWREVDLNAVLGNNNDNFQWSRQGFSSSSRNVKYDSVTNVLSVELCVRRDDYRMASVNLSERIRPRNGLLSGPGINVELKATSPSQ
jgi:hypothetical protein